MVQTTITAPRNKIINVEIADGRMLTWTSRSGQTHYEIQYRTKHSNAWSTLGKVPSTATSYDLYEIYKLLKKDFQEIYYRVCVYYDITSGEVRDVGYEYTDVYCIIFTHTPTAELLGELSGYDENYPVYEKIDDPTLPFANVSIGNVVHKFPFVEKDAANRGRQSISWKGEERRFTTDELDESLLYKAYGVGIWDRYMSGNKPLYAAYYTPHYGMYTKSRKLYYTQTESYFRDSTSYFYEVYRPQMTTSPYDAIGEKVEPFWYNQGYGPSTYYISSYGVKEVTEPIFFNYYTRRNRYYCYTYSYIGYIRNGGRYIGTGYQWQAGTEDVPHTSSTTKTYYTTYAIYSAPPTFLAMGYRTTTYHYTAYSSSTKNIFDGYREAKKSSYGYYQRSFYKSTQYYRDSYIMSYSTGYQQIGYAVYKYVFKYYT